MECAHGTRAISSGKFRKFLPMFRLSECFEEPGSQQGCMCVCVFVYVCECVHVCACILCMGFVAGIKHCFVNELLDAYGEDVVDASFQGFFQW